MSKLAENLAEVRLRIGVAAERSGRRAEDIKLVAVTKTHPAEVLRNAVELGVSTFGENKVQEAEGKINELGRNAAEWHLIGHLQSNKARKAVQLFDVIQSVDSVELAMRLERICIEEGRLKLSIFLQVDLAGEATKSGIAEGELPTLVNYLRTCDRLRFDGLMILPPFADDAEAMRPFFRRIRKVRDDLLAAGSFENGKGELSMGMSGDYEVAVEEGATIVRVGTAIFGRR